MDISDKGNPDLYAIINDSGSSGSFYVRESTNNLFQVDSSGVVTVHGAIVRNSANHPRVTNQYISSVGTIIDFRTSTGAKYSVDVSSGLLTLKAANTGDDIRVEAKKKVQLNSGDDNNDAVFEFLDDGTKRASIEYNAAGTRIDFISEAGLKALAKSGDLELKVDSNGLVKIDVPVPGGAPPTPMVSLSAGGTERGALVYSGIGVFAQTCRLTSSGTIGITATGEVYIQNAQSGAGDIAALSKGTSKVLTFKWSGASKIVTLEPEAGTVLALKGNNEAVEVGLASSDYFQVRNSSGNMLYQIHDNGTFTWYVNGSTMMDLRKGTFTELEVGNNNSKGCLQLRRGAANGQGVLLLRSNNDTAYYFWVADDGFLRFDTTDPGTTNEPATSRPVGLIHEEEVELTFAEVRALYTSPKTVVSAPSAGKYLEFVSATLVLEYDTAAYQLDADEDLVFRLGSTEVSTRCDAEGFLTETNDEFRHVPAKAPDAVGAYTPDTASPDGIVLALTTDDITTGQGPLTVRCRYRVCNAS